ncbi:PaaI family thioesterase [Kitasatospora sp. MAA4]|uniref:PaaI family thioesterase n=1 Tax=Kitasatospora sp. MAA4 TaxID=3035093 RepID=UPI0024738C6B|nr:PaaI family thioesterase [Kitasatospora sp. MAA4]
MAPNDTDTQGRRMLTGLIDGTGANPPCAELLNLPRATSWSPGLITSATVFPEELTLTPGVVFGGWIACLVDHFAGLAMLSALPDGTGFLTAALAVDYRAPLVPGPADIEAEVTRCSTRHAMVEIRFSQSGRLAAVATVEQIISRAGGQHA